MPKIAFLIISAYALIIWAGLHDDTNGGNDTLAVIMQHN